MPEEQSTQSSDSNVLEREEEADVLIPGPYACAKSFDELNLGQELIKGLYGMKFEKPTELQSKSLPMILTPPYKNIYAHAYCGSGKSTCFIAGMLSRINPALAAPQALCICPTKDLAEQNMKLVEKMCKFTDPDKRSPMMSKVIFGTAGTVKSSIAKKELDTSHLKILMFDDADYMLIEGDSEEDSVWIMKDIHKQECKVQVLLCSSIFNDHVNKFVDKIKDDLQLEQWTPLFVMKDGPTLDLVRQYKVKLPSVLSKTEFIIRSKTIDKIKSDFIIEKILELKHYEQTIIFVNTEKSAQLLHKKLVKAGQNATNFHRALTQEYKDSILKEYECAHIQHLITTDVHARGFDPTLANCVINYDLPPASGSTNDDCELYLHRIGRVGRRQQKGDVFNFMCGDEDEKLMKKIEKYNRNIVKVPLEISDDEFDNLVHRRFPVL